MFHSLLSSNFFFLKVLVLCYQKCSVILYYFVSLFHIACLFSSSFGHEFIFLLRYTVGGFTIVAIPFITTLFDSTGGTGSLGFNSKLHGVDQV